MSITPEQAKRIAKLSRIGISDEEAAKIGPELSNIMGWIDQLNELNTDNVEPLANVANIALQQRADTATNENLQPKVLSNAPESLEGYFVVPKVIE